MGNSLDMKSKGGSSGAVLVKLKANTAPLVYAGTTLRMQSNAENSGITGSAGQGCLSPPIKKFRFGVSGTVKIVFDAKESTSASGVLITKSSLANGQVNRSILGNTGSNASLTAEDVIDNLLTANYVTYTLYARVSPGDEIQIVGSANAASAVTVYVQNAKVYYDFNPTDSVLL